jgi:hypothetical protein
VLRRPNWRSCVRFAQPAAHSARRRRLAVRFLHLTGLLLLAGASSPARAQGSFDEYQVKAAFLYHFAKFVEWPADSFRDAHEPITVCVVGYDPSEGLFEATVRDKSVGGRPLRVRMAKSPQALEGCRLVFVPSSERKRWAKMKESAPRAAVLTVGEGSDFVQQEGIIGLTLEENRVRFEINLEAAERARLKVSSKLLALAKVVHVGNPRGGK